MGRAGEFSDDSPSVVLATVATPRRGEQSLTLHRPQAHPTSNVTSTRRCVERAASSPRACPQFTHGALPKGGRPHSEKTGETCGAFRVTSKRATSFTLSRLRCGPHLQEQSPPPGDLFTRTACAGSAASSHATLTLSIDEDDQVIHPPSAGCQKSGDASPGGDAAPFPIPPI
jgi:hypothetical protein